MSAAHPATSLQARSIVCALPRDWTRFWGAAVVRVRTIHHHRELVDVDRLGDVEVEASVESLGLRFRAAIAAERDEIELVTARCDTDRILVVDDFSDAAESSRILLTLLGHECRTAQTGTAAIDLVAQFDPDIVLLDLSLPDLSGYEVVQTLRARSSVAFIVAMTGTASSGRTLAAGFDLHVLKPASLEQLRGIIEMAGADSRDEIRASRRAACSPRV